MALAGTAAGAWLAMGASSLLNYWLFDLTPTDVISLVSAEGVLIAVSLFACWVPARRASRADPMEILRAI
jgi:ABC-type lipoprotein release transport system permease subunit